MIARGARWCKVFSHTTTLRQSVAQQRPRKAGIPVFADKSLIEQLSRRPAIALCAARQALRKRTAQRIAGLNKRNAGERRDQEDNSMDPNLRQRSQCRNRTRLNKDPTDPPRALLPEFLHQGGAAQKLAPEQGKQLVASGGTSRLESVNYGDAILTDNWPRDGLLLS